MVVNNSKYESEKNEVIGQGPVSTIKLQTQFPTVFTKKGFEKVFMGEKFTTSGYNNATDLHPVPKQRTIIRSE